MSLKDAIVLWSDGVNKALDGKFEEAISVWSSMQEPGARISFNIASMHLLLGRPDKAEKVRNCCKKSCSMGCLLMDELFSPLARILTWLSRRILTWHWPTSRGGLYAS